MSFAPYRAVLQLPGVRTLLLLGLLTRIPATATGLAMTLHVINSLGLNFTAAGVMGAVFMGATGVGSPVAGRLVDRFGLRPVLVATTATQAIFWLVAPGLGYAPLLALALPAGMLTIPVFGVIRQCLAAAVPETQRRTGFALDSIAVELSYMVGPALAAAGVTLLSSRITMYAIGAGMIAAGVSLYLLNPPTKTEQESSAAVIRRRQWLTSPLFAVLIGTAVATFVLAATELSIVALLDGQQAAAWTGLVIGVWCMYSMAGGFIYGGMKRTLSPAVLIAGLCLLTVPIGITGAWQWLLLLLLPAGMLCASSLAATTDAVSKLVPGQARGEAMGLHGAALTIGIATGTPFAGAVIDGYGPGWGFAAAGLAGAAVILIAVLATRYARGALGGVAMHPAADAPGQRTILRAKN